MSLRLSWSEVIGQFGTFSVTYTEQGGLSQYEAGVTNSQTQELAISNLYPSTDYVFTVVTVSGVGESATESSPETCEGRTGGFGVSMITLS